MTSGVATPGGGWRRADPPSTGTRGDQRRTRKGGRRGRDGDPTVEDAEFSSYYGRPIVKPATWKNPEVPLYLFLGGAAGVSSVIGALGEFTGRPVLTRAAHHTAAGGALASVVLLIVDLGRPMRFLHMLRVFKPTSPLSVGSYILSPFSALTVATAGLHVLELVPAVRALPVARWIPGVRKGAAVGAAVFGGPMTTYTAVLLANTATPSWHEPYEELPFLFAGSALAAGGGVSMALSPPAESGPSRKVALAGAAIELAAAHRVEHGHGLVSEPYHLGRAGRLLRAAKACTIGGAGLTLLAGRSRTAGVLAGALLATGSMLTRFGVFDAGMASARDPKYTVVPQRERLAARQAEAAELAGGEARSVTR
ncbi:nitrite reductase [Modestobacter sp. I12A-02628]|uniref:Polysulfide reductase NrfD n=1 Tax=Goekera deserti TaxID=2497753 RepID=A0A7K3WHU3_9ACTN|nr:NrfD/PsrC family molybdoenzyme membrane anchor subunit [Goekera deserti]MPQ97892.1 nitrite reductase [Goekera deserti]NDI48538.1 nitrite reductase [Goekera deserti]NEL55083.1 polysulfide reductase NrfD [Goekera deserti]